jgi:RNA polymerase sigma-70 factor (ECF subfamily)
MVKKSDSSLGRRWYSMAAVLTDPSPLGGAGAQHLTALHARFSAPLHRFFRSYRLNSADVDDLTQDVFVRLARPGRQTNLLKPEAFVFTLARNLVRDRARRLHTKAAAKSVALDDIDLSCERPTPDQSLELEQSLELVEEALASLRLPTREAFLLHRVYGESYADIALRMKISVSMVEKHIMSAMLALQGSIAR